MIQNSAEEREIDNRVLAAVTYADVFRYPLTAAEIRLWIRSEKVISRDIVENSIRRLIRKRKVIRTGAYAVLPGREVLAAERTRRETVSAGKTRLARRAASALSRIPTVRLVLLTGSLAAGNADSGEDIDLYIVSTDGTIWMTRLLAVLVSEILFRRRRYGEKEPGDALCLNMFSTESGMEVPLSERSYYTSHEVLQAVPLYAKGNAYRGFLEANAWTKSWFAARYAERTRGMGEYTEYSTGIPEILAVWISHAFEPCAKAFQLLYMSRHRTTETVSDTHMRFHAKDAKIRIRKALSVRMKRSRVGLDKVFSGI